VDNHLVSTSRLASEFVEDSLWEGGIAFLVGYAEYASRLINNDDVLILVDYFEILIAKELLSVNCSFFYLKVKKYDSLTSADRLVEVESFSLSFFIWIASFALMSSADTVVLLWSLVEIAKVGWFLDGANALAVLAERNRHIIAFLNSIVFNWCTGSEKDSLRIKWVLGLEYTYWFDGRNGTSGC
jgi:hypothetical protein